jgi:diguanylate cyclase (GGDEF)-like protein
MSDDEPRTVVLDGKKKRAVDERLIATLSVLEGPEIGAFFALDPGRHAHRIGRAEDADVRINAPSVSRYHAICIVKMKDGHVATKVRDNGSTNGVLINGNPTNEGWLIAGDKIRLGDVLMRFQWMPEDEARYHSDVSDRIRAAEKDHLTGLHTRAWVFDRLPALLADGGRRDAPVSLFLMDLDHFKRINDTHGHLAGDTALARAGSATLGVLGARDHGVRYGGEEFLVVLPDQDLAAAAEVAERCRVMLTVLDLSDASEGLAVTASFGVAERGAEESVEEWIQRADDALYRAKDGGRNQVARAAAPAAPDATEDGPEVETWRSLPAED